MVLTVFSVPAFFLVVREVLEACLVVGIMLAYLNKTGNTHLRRYVWLGALTGVILSLLIGGTFVTVYHVKRKQILNGRAENIFEGVVFLIAAALLSWGVLWVQSLSRHVQSAVENATDAVLDSDNISASKFTIFAVVLVQVLREGIETFVFLLGASGSGNWKAIPLPGVLGIIVGLAMAYAVFRGLLQLDIALFFRISTVILTAFAAGLASQALHELQEAGAFGDMDTTSHWWNAPLWDMRACCSVKKNEFFAFLRALFGYQDQPTFVDFASYFLYWLLASVTVLAINWHVVRASKNQIARTVKIFAAFSLLGGLVSFPYALGLRRWNGILVSSLLFALSIPSCIMAFDAVASRLPRWLARQRRAVALFLCVAFSLFTLLTISLHVTQMACDEPTTGCSLPKYYYFGLIFNDGWAEEGRKAESWNSLAVLAVSLVLTTFLGGSFSLALGLFAGNVLSADGAYLYEAEAVKDDETGDKLDLTDNIRGVSASERGYINPLLA